MDDSATTGNMVYKALWVHRIHWAKFSAEGGIGNGTWKRNQNDKLPFAMALGREKDWCCGYKQCFCLNGTQSL